MTYKLVYDYLLHDPTDLANWRAHVLDEEGFIVCEVWNNGYGGGNFYVWHNAEARWAIEDEALRDFTGDDKEKMDYYRHGFTDDAMDAWIERLPVEKD
jgi:hypothetical protein